MAALALSWLILGTAGANSGATDSTWSADIVPILRTRCVECHHPDGAAPFSLTTFDQVRAWSKAIARTVENRTMPPWHADSPTGTFSNDRRLLPAERQTLLGWLANGLPPGSESPELIESPATRGWRIGTPDLIFELPEAVQIAAEGEIPYTYVRVPTNFAEDVWVQAAEARPGNRLVVHHIIVDFFDPDGKPSPGQDARTAGSLGSYVPGDEPLILPDGVGRRIPKGSILVFQLHYTASGKPETDRSSLGLVLSKSAVQHESRTGLVSSPFIHIPAGEPSHSMTATVDLESPIDLVSMTPHMHLRGSAFSYKAHLPNGETLELLHVPRYDFDWQTTYRLQHPIRLPTGTTLECVATYDNSATNPRNPDPSKNVGWGEQTWQEMMIGFYDYLVVDSPSPQPTELP